MKHIQCVIVLLLLCINLLASSPEILITGTVKEGSLPLNGAIVSLVSDATILDTTGTDGTFELTNATGIAGPYNQQFVQEVTLGINGTELSLSLPCKVTEGTITFYSGNGKRIAHIPLNKLSAGKHQVELPALSSGFYVMCIEAGRFTATRKMIVTNAAAYLNKSVSQKKENSTLLGKKMQDEIDQIKVEKEGYVTATIGIQTYQEKDLEITLSEESSGPCSGGKLATTDVTKKGPFETVTEDVPEAILVRPKELLDGCLYPIVTWGHGAMGSPNDYKNLMNILASHGFVVIGSTARNVEDGASEDNQWRNQMVEVAAWVVEQNSNLSSVLYQKIDIDKVGAAGHSQGGYGASVAGRNPLITTSVSSCGATGSEIQQGPALILCGGNDNTPDSRCSAHPEGAYNGTSNVPVMKAEFHNADHGWCMDQLGSSDPNKPHEMLFAMTAWFRYHLMDDEEYKSWFYGSDCYLCNHENWTVKSKNMD